MSGIKRRAVTQAQKLFRRQEILSGARCHFEAVGYERFSMRQLASQLGIVKGTLYLYFPTKEAIVLALYSRALEDWSQVVKTTLADALTEDDFVQFFYDSAMADPILVPILVRLEHVIEHNISIALLIDSKRHFKACLNAIADEAALALDLPITQARELIITLGILLSGATLSDQGPSLIAESLPEDVREFLNSLSSKKIFITNGRRILAGIRCQS